MRSTIAALALLLLLPDDAAGRGKARRGKAKSAAKAAQRGRKPGGGEYVPSPWEGLVQIEPSEPGPAEAQRLPMLGMPGDFMEERWQRRLTLARRGPGLYDGLMRGFGDLEKVIAANDFELGRDAKFALGGQTAQMSGTLDIARAQDGYGRGATLVLNALEKVWPPCRDLAREVEGAIGIYTSMNMYFTPPHSRGFDPHFDYEDVFIIQVNGRKKWRVWEPDEAVGQQRLPLNDARSKPGKSAVPTTEPKAVLLEPGDVLYIPRGWPHVAETEGESPSIHITMTLHVQDFTWESLLRYAVLSGDQAKVNAESTQYSLGLGPTGSSVTPAVTDPTLKAALRAKSPCSSRPKVVGAVGRSATVELLLLIALRDAAHAQPELREVHAPSWPDPADDGALARLVELWAERVSAKGVDTVLDCAEEGGDGASMAEARELLHKLVAGYDVAAVKAWATEAYAPGFISGSR